MKPSHAYQSLAKARNKIGLALFLCLLAQIFYYSLATFRVPLPARLIESAINSFLPEEVRVEVNLPRIVGLSKIEIGTFNFWVNQTNLIHGEDLSVSLNPIFENRFLPSIIEQIKLSRAQVLPAQKGSEELEILEFSVDQNPLKKTWVIKSRLSLGSIQSNVIFNSKNLAELFQKNTPNAEDSSFEIVPIVKKIEAAKRKLSDWVEYLPPVQMDILGRTNAQYAQFHIFENKKNQGGTQDVENLSCMISVNLSPQRDHFLDIDLDAVADHISISTDSSSFRFIEPKISSEWRLFRESPQVTNHKSVFSCVGVDINGKVIGTAPPVSIHIHGDERGMGVQCFSESNGTSASLNFLKKDTYWQGSGVVSLKPSMHDFLVKLPQGELKIIEGESLEIKFYSNPTPKTANSTTQFLIKAKQFSALETPPGKFFIRGEVSQDFSLFIHNAYGQLGLSEVTGSYFQKWQPAEYRFLIDGKCHPPDIDNWLGVWWPPLWNDFSFSSEIPTGNFSIQGIWGGIPGNSVTIGKIKTKGIGFKDFHMESSSVSIEVDRRSTRLNAHDISHKYGKATGTLVFPRSLEKSDVLLAFSIDGDFPINEGKTILGKEVENTLADFNISSVFCSGKGSVLKEKQMANDENGTWFDLYLSADSPFSYSGLKLDYARGEIRKKKGLLHANFDEFGISEGTGNLTISQTSITSDQISFSMDLTSADRDKLFTNVSHSSQWANKATEKPPPLSPEEKDEIGGKIDFSINAEGPISDFKHFEGTGNVEIYDVDIGSIHILGGIRNKLGAFNLPLPSDALNFNRLEAPFRLDHDRISFDRASLTGPLSKFEANGEVNWINQRVDLLAKFQVAGNLKIPLLKQIVNLADPLSKLSKLKIQGDWEDPDWSIHLGTNPLTP